MTQDLLESKLVGSGTKEGNRKGMSEHMGRTSFAVRSFLLTVMNPPGIQGSPRPSPPPLKALSVAMHPDALLVSISANMSAGFRTWAVSCWEEGGKSGARG